VDETAAAELVDGLKMNRLGGTARATRPAHQQYFAGEDRSSTVVKPNPRATGLTLDETVADYLHREGFCNVDDPFEVEQPSGGLSRRSSLIQTKTSKASLATMRLAAVSSKKN